MSTTYNLELQSAIEDFKSDCNRLGQDLMKNVKSLPVTVAFLIQMPDNKFACAVIGDAHSYYDKNNKQKFVNYMQTMIKAARPVALCVLSEAWMVKRDKDKVKNFNIAVSEEPDRKEVIIVQIETFKDASVYIYDIIRNGDDVELKLDVDHVEVDKKNTDGIFSNLLKENYDKLHEEFMSNINKSKN